MGDEEDAEEPVERVHEDDLEASKPHETDPLVAKERPGLDRLRGAVRKVIVTRALEKAGEEHRKRFGVPKPEDNLFGVPISSPNSISDGEVGLIEWNAADCKQIRISVSDIRAPASPGHCRWILHNGRDPAVVHALNKLFDLGLSSSSLAADETRESFARCYDNHLHIVLHIMSINAKGESENEQVNILVGKNFIITQQESHRAHFAKLADRLAKNGGRIREKGLLYVLVQVLLVCIVSCNPVIAYYGDTVENLEISFTFGAKREFMLRVQTVKRELLLLRKAMRPLIEIIDLLPRLHSPMGEKWVQAKEDRKNLKGQLQEVHKRLKASIDLIETYRELCVSIQELSNMDQDHEMNRVLYVLTMVTTIFVPCSFLAGVYGMNFKYFPELDYKWAYPVWWVVVITIMFSLAMLFRYKRWN